MLDKVSKTNSKQNLNKKTYKTDNNHKPNKVGKFKNKQKSDEEAHKISSHHKFNK